MYKFGKINVKPNIPKRISKIVDLSYNLWWSWNSYALRIFEMIDNTLWAEVKYNPIKFLNIVSQEKLNKAINNTEFLKYFDDVISKFEGYINNENTIFNKDYSKYKGKKIAYLSMEFGLDETLPIYSGGLGILAGDHLKSASDLGIPLTGIGLMYSEGFFIQHVDKNGDQVEFNPIAKYSDLPIKNTKDKEGNDLIVCASLPTIQIYAKVYEINIGRNKLYLLDSNIPENNSDLIHLTDRLYGGDQETRILQEILLGIGGMNLLRSLDIRPDVCHMNEGHAAFLALDLIKTHMENNNTDFNVAKAVVNTKAAFTIHTPVPAGIDTFPNSLVEKYFNKYWDSLNISKDEFLSLGTMVGIPGQFNMAVLALNTAGKRNGVSKLHGAVTREMFAKLWNNISLDEVPIGHVTNGVHTCTWLAPTLKDLFNKYLPTFWQDTIHDTKMFKAIESINDNELWDAHILQKKKLIEMVNNYIIETNKSNGIITETSYLLKSDVLTIGFARRFATYKRADLLFKDLERITKILNNSDMPVQIIYAGKAHPADKPGQDIIKNIISLSNSPQFKGKIYFIENYSMSLSRYLISGCDVWLNNPRRPMEASGTSGQKAGLNGVINFSVLDGWWCEGYNAENGFSIGDDTIYPNYEIQDNADSNNIYDTLENSLIPAYYFKHNGTHTKWIHLMKESIKSIAPMYSTSRMVLDYLNNVYLPLIDMQSPKLYNKTENVIAYLEYKERLLNNFNKITISSSEFNENIDTTAMNTIDLSCTVDLKNISPDEIDVQVYYGKIDSNGAIDDAMYKSMILSENSEKSTTFTYRLLLELDKGGEYGYTYRVTPKNNMNISPNDLNCVKWLMY